MAASCCSAATKRLVFAGLAGRAALRHGPSRCGEVSVGCCSSIDGGSAPCNGWLRRPAPRGSRAGARLRTGWHPTDPVSRLLLAPPIDRTVLRRMRAAALFRQPPSQSASCGRAGRRDGAGSMRFGLSYFPRPFSRRRPAPFAPGWQAHRRSSFNDEAYAHRRDPRGRKPAWWCWTVIGSTTSMSRRLPSKQLKGNIYLAKVVRVEPQPPGRLRRVWRRSPWLPRLRGDPPRLLPDPRRRPAAPAGDAGVPRPRRKRRAEDAAAAAAEAAGNRDRGGIGSRRRDGGRRTGRAAAAVRGAKPTRHPGGSGGAGFHRGAGRGPSGRGAGSRPPAGTASGRRGARAGTCPRDGRSRSDGIRAPGRRAGRRTWRWSRRTSPCPRHPKRWRAAPADEAEDRRTPTRASGSARREARPPRFMRSYKIQEVIRRRQILLVQVVKEERGTKGAALTTFISLAGRFFRADAQLAARRRHLLPQDHLRRGPAAG